MNESLRIAVASGKGGTGKTTLAVALTLAVPGAQLLDCDVEEPDAHLFLDVRPVSTEVVSTVVPEHVEERCDHCAGRPVPVCREVCAFGAIATLPDRVMVFPEICHGCGACLELCPRRAFVEVRRPVGTVESGLTGDHSVVTGRLNVGEPRPVDVVRAVRARTSLRGVTILDVAPGTSCPVVEAIRGVDVVTLVSEPTPFGLHDLALAADLCERLDLPAGVVLNRADIGDDRVERFCEERGLPILLRLPHDRRIAEGNARGVPLTVARPDLAHDLRRLVDDLRSIASEEVAA